MAICKLVASGNDYLNYFDQCLQLASLSWARSDLKSSNDEHSPKHFWGNRWSISFRHFSKVVRTDFQIWIYRHQDE